MEKIPPYKKILILLDIRSSHNVGSLFRTADAIGVQKIYLIGTTPDPIDRFGRPNPDIAKTALGAEQTIPYEYYKTFVEVFALLQKEHVAIVGLEQYKDSVDYKQYVVQNDTALIVGNEVDGILESVLEKIDATIEIPMRGEKESLNVSVAGGIALFRIFDN
ncbi:MAG: TrmH family RNA methyltransferase [bacterium]